MLFLHRFHLDYSHPSLEGSQRSMVDSAFSLVEPQILQEPLGSATSAKNFWGQFCEIADGLASQVTDPAGLLGMVGAGLTYKVARFGLMNTFSSLGARGPLVRYASNLMAFGGEASLFPIYTRLGSVALGREVDWSRPQLVHDIKGSFLVLGGLKLFGAAATGAFNRIHGVNPTTGLAARGVDQLAASRLAISQAGMFTGILAGQKAEQGFGLIAPISNEMLFAQSLVTLLHFNAAGKIIPVMTGRGFQRTEQDLERTNRQMVQQLEGGARTFIDPPLTPSFAWAFPSRNSRTRNPSRTTEISRPQILQMANHGNEGGGPWGRQKSLGNAVTARVKRLQWSKGLSAELEFEGDAFERLFAAIPQEVQARQGETRIQVPIITPSEFETLEQELSAVGSIPLEAVPRIIQNRISDIEGILRVGGGPKIMEIRQRGGDAPYYYGVMDWPLAQLARRELGLDDSDFQIPLASRFGGREGKIQVIAEGPEASLARLKNPIQEILNQESETRPSLQRFVVNLHGVHFKSEFSEEAAWQRLLEVSRRVRLSQMTLEDGVAELRRRIHEVIHPYYRVQALVDLGEELISMGKLEAAERILQEEDLRDSAAFPDQPEDWYHQMDSLRITLIQGLIREGVSAGERGPVTHLGQFHGKLARCHGWKLVLEAMFLEGESGRARQLILDFEQARHPQIRLNREEAKLIWRTFLTLKELKVPEPSSGGGSGSPPGSGSLLGLGLGLGTLLHSGVVRADGGGVFENVSRGDVVGTLLFAGLAVGGLWLRHHLHRGSQIPNSTPEQLGAWALGDHRAMTELTKRTSEGDEPAYRELAKMAERNTQAALALKELALSPDHHFKTEAALRLRSLDLESVHVEALGGDLPALELLLSLRQSPIDHPKVDRIFERFPWERFDYPLQAGEHFNLVYEILQFAQDKKSKDARELLRNINTHQLLSLNSMDRRMFELTFYLTRHGDAAARAALQNTDPVGFLEGLIPSERPNFIHRYLVPAAMMGNKEAREYLRSMEFADFFPDGEWTVQRLNLLTTAQDFGHSSAGTWLQRTVLDLLRQDSLGGGEARPILQRFDPHYFYRRHHFDSRASAILELIQGTGNPLAHLYRYRIGIEPQPRMVNAPNVERGLLMTPLAQLEELINFMPELGPDPLRSLLREFIGYVWQNWMELEPGRRSQFYRIDIRNFDLVTVDRSAFPPNGIPVSFIQKIKKDWEHGHSPTSRSQLQ